MKPVRTRHKYLLIGLSGIAVLLICAAGILIVRRHGLSRADWSNVTRSEEHGDWHAFGGAWQSGNGVIRNDSDDRGAKLISDRKPLQNSMIEADVRLLGEYGFAGLTIRSSDAEEGVDAYRGYTAGLSDLDNALFLGHADFGWQGYAVKTISPRIFDQQWYHLKLLAYDCIIAVSATGPGSEMESLAVKVPNCIDTGQFGLRSYNTGAEWKNVNIGPASRDDLIAMIGNTPPPVAVPSQYPAGYDAAINSRFFEPLHRDLLEHRSDPAAQSIRSLRLLSPILSSPVTVHGVVTLTTPILFVQDSTGGLAIPGHSTRVPLEIGDEVEVKGDAEQHDFSSVLLHASVRKLWSHTSVQPVSITASEAATGSFDADSIDIQGTLRGEHVDSTGKLVLTLEDGSQSFFAILGGAGHTASTRHLRPLSRVRLRGICVTDATYTGNDTPFAVLLSSYNDIQVVMGPPWWNVEHVILLIIAFVLVSATGLTLFLLVQRRLWQAAVDERERLALEMHDTLAQSFAGLGFQLEAIQDEVGEASHVNAMLDAARAMVKSSREEAHRSVASLHPEGSESIGLLHALEKSVHRMMSDCTSISVRTISTGEEYPLSLHICDGLFRIGQEAIANAITHGRPSNITISLSYLRSSVELAITDDGSGFVESSESAGFGLRGMSRRAEAISAQLTIRSVPGEGTEVHIVCPRGASGWTAYLQKTLRPLLGRAESHVRTGV
jgi:two-component sensor histidine kinase